MTKISLIVPVFNEEEPLQLFYQAVRSQKSLRDYDVEIIFINDGSYDSTVEVIKELQKQDELVTLVNLSRNFGKEAALFAGLDYATGEAVIPLDVDLQDPIDILPQLLSKWREGIDVVLAKRKDRTTDSWLKRQTANWYYKIHNSCAKEKIEENVGDFRLLSRNTVEKIKALPEKNIFMKGLMSWVGGEVAIVEFVRSPRISGKSKFNAWKLWNFALDGITSFSTLPLRIWTYVGLFIAFPSFIYGGWVIVSKLAWGNVVAGYSSLMVALLFLGGVQLIGIGILGEYIGRIYTETKSRPRYVVKSVIKGKTTDSSQVENNF
jgi:polyisoprenyl-phosphate glycosyltransferase